MYKNISQILSPKHLYNICNYSWPSLAIISFCLTIFTLFYLFLTTPIDLQQGIVAKLMYIHVPSAILSMAIFASLGILGACFIIFRLKVAIMIFRAILPIGMLLTFLVLFTGSIWGKPTWGTWWIWDARLTSELILCFLYFSIYTYDQVLGKKTNTPWVISVLAVIGTIDLPIIHYSVQWWHTLHQGPSILAFKKPSIAWTMLWPMLLMLLAIACSTLSLAMLRCKRIILTSERNSKWVQQLEK